MMDDTELTEKAWPGYPQAATAQSITAARDALSATAAARDATSFVGALNESPGLQPATRPAEKSMTDVQAPPPAPPMETFTRDTLRSHVAQRRYAYVEFPELGRKIRVQSLHTKEVAAAEDAGVKLQSGGKGKPKVELRSVRALLFAYSVVGEDGQRLYNPNDPNDIAEIGRMDNRITATTVKKARELTGGMDGTDDEEDGEEGK